MASVSAMFARLDEMEGAANRTYRLVLERYPRNAKLLRSYGRFLEGVRNDPYGAAKYYAEADKQDELAAAAAAPEAASLLAIEGGGSTCARV
jgi:Tfp pilus assembly protein PilF